MYYVLTCHMSLQNFMSAKLLISTRKLSVVSDLVY